jgi:hypothetical protein
MLSFSIRIAQPQGGWPPQGLCNLPGARFLQDLSGPFLQINYLSLAAPGGTDKIRWRLPVFEKKPGGSTGEID